MGGSAAVAAIEFRGPDVAFEQSYQERVAGWLHECFGSDVASSKLERTHRFLEEALELAQAGGCSRADALALVDYVYSRPVGDIRAETGGVLVTLAGMAEAYEIEMAAAGETELARNQARTSEIREKRARKLRNSPLP